MLSNTKDSPKRGLKCAVVSQYTWTNLTKQCDSVFVIMTILCILSGIAAMSQIIPINFGYSIWFQFHRKDCSFTLPS